MAATDFQNRWKRTTPPADHAAAPEADAPVAKPQNIAPPTLEDAAKLRPDSDYTAFVAKGVDENVKRAAMKKLFADPHFNIMDGLDVYIEDFNKFEPIPAAMLSQLTHARQLLDPLKNLSAPVMQMIDADPPAEAASDALPQQAHESLAIHASGSIEPLPGASDTHPALNEEGRIAVLPEDTAAIAGSSGSLQSNAPMSSNKPRFAPDSSSDVDSRFSS